VLVFSHDLHAAHDTNALFKTSVGRVFDLLDNRLFRLFKTIWIHEPLGPGGFFFWGGKPAHIQKSKQLPVLLISKPHQVAGKNQRRTGSFFLVSSSNCLRTMTINCIYVTGYYNFQKACLLLSVFFYYGYPLGIMGIF
jgi:hypothetical protein